MTQTTSRIAIAIVLGALALTAPVLTAGTAEAAPKKGTVMKMEPKNDRVEARIKTLHDKLGVTAAQEPQWKKVAAVMRQNERSVHKLVEARHANESASAIDDLKSYEKIADAHAAGLKRMIPAFQALYDTMSSEQKESADSLFGKFEGHEHHKNSRNNSPPNQSK